MPLLPPHCLSCRARSRRAPSFSRPECAGLRAPRLWSRAQTALGGDRGLGTFVVSCKEDEE
eukprot:6036032-Pleurochrysis_carterae.AAC.1